MNKITIVTAFFDIGRGDISTEDYPTYLKRTTDTYFDYFSNLAKLENEMVIFTQKEFEQKIWQIRDGRPTKVVIFDFHNKFKYIRNRVSKIQDNKVFQSKVNPNIVKNIEYWSSNYALVTNLKIFFVNQAIQRNLTTNNQIAWVDFGYVRDKETLNNVKEWKMNFDPNKIHFFSIVKSELKLNNLDDVLDFIYNNKTYIIGGAIVSTKEKWGILYELLFNNQKYCLRNNIIDDDQGLYIMCLYKNPALFQINYLGKNQWFSLFKKYDETAKISLLEKIKDKYGW